MKSVGGHNLHERIEPIIKESGRLLLSYFKKPLQWKRKKGGSFVTDADYAVQEYLITELKKVMPEAGFIAEESAMAQAGTDQDYYWVIDPIDGTYNFAQGIPYFCISVGLTYQNKPIFGVVYQPITNEFFHAYSKNGAYLDGQPIAVSSDGKDRNLMVVGRPLWRKKEFTRTMKEKYHNDALFVAHRYFGAAALDQAYMAAGRIDGLCFRSLSWWDIAAGLLLVQEAGGVVTDLKGRPLEFQDTNSYLAGNKIVHEALLATIKPEIINKQYL